MDREACAALIAFAAAAGMKVDVPPEEMTTAWATVLEDVTPADARQAVTNLVRSTPFLDASGIYQEVRRIRDDRIARFGQRPAPNDGVDYGVELRAMTAAIASGAFTRDMVPAYEQSGAHFSKDTFTPAHVAAYAARALASADPSEVARGRAIGRRLGIPMQEPADAPV